MVGKQPRAGAGDGAVDGGDKRAAPLAALLKDRERKGAKFAVIASGGNIDREAYASVLAG